VNLQLKRSFAISLLCLPA